MAQGVGKDTKKFTPGEASSYETRQTTEGVTIAAVPYDREELTKAAFDKLDPNKHGVLPVLVIIQNDNKHAIRLDGMQVAYVAADRSRIEATPAKDVPYLEAPRRPKMPPGPIPGIRLSKKNPLAAPEIEQRAFAARMLPPGDSAHGFFYFQTRPRGGSKLYISGLQDASSGQDLFFFEIPLEK
ncbi:MAG: hypothetical protein HYS04_00715 [Acidobacteria bacterium]|nr:hypothetical protein [Acidobacteriota bacterium]